MKTNELIHLGSRTKISPECILMLKSDANYTTIYLDDGSQILSSTTIGILEKRLSKFPFFRPNRSFVINLQFVSDFEKSIHSSRIFLKNKEEIPLSRRRTSAFLEIIR